MGVLGSGGSARPLSGGGTAADIEKSKAAGFLEPIVKPIGGVKAPVAPGVEFRRAGRSGPRRPPDGTYRRSTVAGFQER